MEILSHIGEENGHLGGEGEEQVYSRRRELQNSSNREMISGTLLKGEEFWQQVKRTHDNYYGQWWIEINALHFHRCTSLMKGRDGGL